VHSVVGTNDGCHRYRGVIRNGAFHLRFTHPPMTAVDVRDVLDLMQLALGSKAIPVDNHEEESRMREAYYEETGERARIRNGKIKTDGGRHAIVRCKFVTQFLDRSPWDVAGWDLSPDRQEFLVMKNTFGTMVPTNNLGDERHSVDQVPFPE